MHKRLLAEQMYCFCVFYLKTICTGSCGCSIKCKSKIIPVPKCLHVCVMAVKLQHKLLVTQVSRGADLDDCIPNNLALCCKSKLHILDWLLMFCYVCSYEELSLELCCLGITVCVCVTCCIRYCAFESNLVSNLARFGDFYDLSFVIRLTYS